MGDLRRMYLVFACELTKRLFLFGRFEGETEFEISTPLLMFLGHAPSRNSVQTLYNALRFLWSRF
jgi:hypothetical protein